MPCPDVILIPSVKQNIKIKTQIAYEMKNNQMKGLITIFTASHCIICFAFACKLCFLKPYCISSAVFTARVIILNYKRQERTSLVFPYAFLSECNTIFYIINNIQHFFLSLQEIQLI